MIVVVSFLLVAIASQKSTSTPSQTPVIGIYTQLDGNLNLTYIAASYSKFFEMSGAQVVPIYSSSEPSEIKELLQKINGVVFQGGSMEFNITTRWTINADIIFKYAIESNKKGNIFPLYGICHGLQLFAYLTSNYYDKILTRVHGDDNIILPIRMVEQGYIYENLNENHIRKLTQGNGVMLFNHNWSVTAEAFNKNSLLKSFWKLTATATTPFKQEFVASMEAKDYPFFASQYHPEKCSFQWKVNADRSRQTIQIAQIISSNFVQLAKRNKNKYMDSSELQRSLLYNFQTRDGGIHFTQVYILDQPNLHVIVDQKFMIKTHLKKKSKLKKFRANLKSDQNL